MEWDEGGLEIVRRNVIEDNTVSNLDKKNIEMTESRRPPEGRRASLSGLHGGPTGRVTLAVRLGYHLDKRCRMRIERLTLRISWKRSGLARHPGCGYAWWESSRSADVWQLLDRCLPKPMDGGEDSLNIK